VNSCLVLFFVKSFYLNHWYVMLIHLKHIYNF
jgi:hypothetical protein